MIEAKSRARGISTPHGDVASTRKNNAPVSFTVRRTSESGSLAASAAASAEPGAFDRTRRSTRRSATDELARDPDARSWVPAMAQPTMRDVRHPLRCPSLKRSLKRWEDPMNVARDPRTPAEIYEEMFVPALFAHWGPVLCEAARIGSGDTVLDVA